jgi:hypothetical protein
VRDAVHAWVGSRSLSAERIAPHLRRAACKANKVKSDQIFKVAIAVAGNEKPAKRPARQALQQVQPSSRIPALHSAPLPSKPLENLVNFPLIQFGR